MSVLEEKNIVLIFDFDSTVVCSETLEDLAEYVLKDRNDKGEIFTQISNITKKGMEGEISFPESLTERLKLFQAHKKDIEYIAQQTTQHITDSFLKHQKFISENAENIYVVSGGFREMIYPSTRMLGIDDSHVFANDFEYDDDEYVIGARKENFLAQEEGKVKQVGSLNLSGEVWVIGDGYTDYAIKGAGAAQKFFAFVEHVFREPVVAHADAVLSSFDDLIVHIDSLQIKNIK